MKRRRLVTDYERIKNLTATIEDLKKLGYTNLIKDYEKQLNELKLKNEKDKKLFDKKPRPN